MGDGEYNNLKLYMRDDGTGEYFEIGGEIKEVNIEPETDTEFVNGFSLIGDFEFVADIPYHILTTIRYRYFPETFNNWRRLHGLPLIRRRHAAKRRKNR